jgi:hypothetical protein
VRRWKEDNLDADEVRGVGVRVSISPCCRGRSVDGSRRAIVWQNLQLAVWAMYQAPNPGAVAGKETNLAYSVGSYAGGALDLGLAPVQRPGGVRALSATLDARKSGHGLVE